MVEVVLPEEVRDRRQDRLGVEDAQVAKGRAALRRDDRGGLSARLRPAAADERQAEEALARERCVGEDLDSGEVEVLQLCGAQPSAVLTCESRARLERLTAYL